MVDAALFERLADLLGQREVGGVFAAGHLHHPPRRLGGQVGEDVDLGDAAGHGGAELFVGEPGAAVQHQRDVDGGADLGQQVEGEFGVAFVLAVRCADGHGEEVDPGFGDETGCCGRVGESLALGAEALVRIPLADDSQFALDRRSQRVPGAHHRARAGDVLVEFQLGAVEHDVREAEGQGPDAVLEAGAVVQDERDRHAGAFGHGAHAGDERPRVGLVEDAGVNGDDPRGPLLFEGVEDSLGAHHVEGVEAGDRIAVLLRLFQLVQDRYQRHSSSLLVLRNDG